MEVSKVRTHPEGLAGSSEGEVNVLHIHTGGRNNSCSRITQRRVREKQGTRGQLPGFQHGDPGES